MELWMCHQFNEFWNYYSSYNKIGIQDAKLMDRARLKERRICKYFIKNIGDILAYVRKRKGRLSKRFTRFQTPMHAQREVSHALFLKLKQFWKICPENTLVNCITQSFLFVNTILKVSESFHFLIISKNISCSA